MNDSYKIVRFYQDEKRRPRVIRKNLTLEQARKWCSDMETSSMTARKPEGCDQDAKQIERWHEKQKHWFDGFTSEL